MIAGTYNWFGPITLTPDPYAHWGMNDATPVAASGKRRQLLTTGGAKVAAAAGAAAANPQAPGVCDDGTGGDGVGASRHQCSSSSSSTDMVQQHNNAEILFTPLRRLQQSSGSSSSMSAPVTGRVTLNETGVGTPSSAQDAARKDGQTWLDDYGQVQIIGPVRFKIQISARHGRGCRHAWNQLLGWWSPCLLMAPLQQRHHWLAICMFAIRCVCVGHLHARQTIPKLQPATPCRATGCTGCADGCVLAAPAKPHKSVIHA